MLFLFAFDYFFTSFEDLQIITPRVIGQLRILKYIQAIHMVAINFHMNFCQFFSFYCCNCSIIYNHMSIVDYSWLQSGQGHMEKATSRSQIYAVILRIHFNNYLLKSAILPHEEHHLYVLLIFKLKYYVAFFLEAPFIAVFRVITAISLTQCYILILLTPKSIFSSFSPYFYFSWFLYHLL